MTVSNTLRKQTVLEIFGQADAAHQQREGQNVTITATCSIFEGRFCWLGSTYLVGALPKELAVKMIKEIGERTVENGAQNQLMIRCSKPINADEPITCQINGGNGWRDYPLSE